jgi:GT2 family glycosyltransferase
MSNPCSATPGPGTEPPAIPSAQAAPRVAIIIPTCNNLNLTRRCLEAIYARTPAPAHEILVVDSGSTDGTVEFLRAEAVAGRLRAILNVKNSGFARGCNQGARAARGNYLVFLSGDTEVQPNWLEPLYCLAEDDPAIAVVGGKLLFPDGTIHHAGVALADCWDLDPLLAFYVFARERANLPLANQRRVYAAVTSACMLARKSRFEEIGGFDEEYQNRYEDVDLCLRLHERGGLTVYEPASVSVYHEPPSGLESFPRLAGNMERFHRKWLEKASPDVIIDSGGKNRVSQSSVMRLYSRPNDLIPTVIMSETQVRHAQHCVAG